MEYKSVGEIAKLWHLSERSVRNYCAKNRIPGAFLTGKTWNVPADAKKPKRAPSANNQSVLLTVLNEEKNMRLKGGIYHKTQILLTYNSNHIEGSTLTEEQTRLIFETNTIGQTAGVNVDDIVETNNHFKCFDMIIENAKKPLSEKFIKQLHFALKVGTSDSIKPWFKVGDYKQRPNEVGGRETCSPDNVSFEMKKLIDNYNAHQEKTIEDIIEFHTNFERIHPFQDGNGRVGRLVMFKECLANNIVPFIIDEKLKMFYYRGLQEWRSEKGYLIETCKAAQDQYKKYLDYFKIDY